jgi:predicted N-acetyltransferase YhbS
MEWLVEQAHPSDGPEVHDIVARAFGREDEAQLVDRLIVSEVWLPGLALVARPAGAPHGSIVGFAALSRITVGGRPALALAPVAVAPGWQQKGAGSALVRAGIARARQRGERLILVLGDPRYYGRFGFRAAIPMGIHGPYDEAGPAFQALVPPGVGPVPSGLAVYPDLFAGL